MDKPGLDHDDGSRSSPDDNIPNPEEARELVIQKGVRTLVHATHCGDTNCELSLACRKMTKVIVHATKCQLGGVSCQICQLLMALCFLHSKDCNKIPCKVPFCTNMKIALMQQQATPA